jgi:hypothetical protein
MTDLTFQANLQSLPLSTLLPEWTNRRRVIFYSLAFCGCIFGIIVIVACTALFVNLFIKSSIDTNISQLLESILYTTSFVATSIIGSYVFGANFDYSNSRSNISQILTQIPAVQTQVNKTERCSSDIKI